MHTSPQPARASNTVMGFGENNLSRREVTLCYSIWLKGCQTGTILQKTLFKTEPQQRPENREHRQRVAIRPTPAPGWQKVQERSCGKQRGQTLQEAGGSPGAEMLSALFLRIAARPPNSDIPSWRKGASRELPVVNRKLTEGHISRKNRCSEDSWGVCQHKWEWTLAGGGESDQPICGNNDRGFQGFRSLHSFGGGLVFASTFELSLEQPSLICVLVTTT